MTIEHVAQSGTAEHVPADVPGKALEPAEDYSHLTDVDGDGIVDGTPWNPIDAEIVDDDADDDGAVVLVDSPEAQRPEPVTLDRLRTAERRPIVPSWARSRSEARDALRVTGTYVGHAAAYHLAHSPVYAARLASRSPVGLVRLITATVRWLLDLEGQPVRNAAVRDEDPAEYLALARHRDHRVRWRSVVVGVVVLAVLLSAFGISRVDGPAQWAVIAGVVAVLGVAGRPADRPLLDRAVDKPQVQKLTSEHVVKALSVLGLAGINQAVAKDPHAIRFVAPVRQDGPGWRADVDLPPGVTAVDIIERRDKLASGLSRPLGAVWPESAPDVHPGRLVLWVGQQDMATARQSPWPLLKSGAVDMFQPFAFGTDPRGRPVHLELMYGNFLLGGIPGSGKTASLRVPLLAAALDKTCEIWCFELKGSGDMEALAQVATRYGSGPDDDTIEAALVALRDLRKECARRAKVIAGLPRADAPEHKVTAELARKPSLRLHPLVLAIDESQELFSHPKFGGEAGDLAEKVIKLGRALGVILILSTQRPDKDSLPTGISANVSIRFALRVMDQISNDLILGTSSYRAGIRATMLTRRDRGVGYLVGASDDAQITRTYYLDALAADKVAERARRLREAAGTLTGYAAGELEEGKPRPDTILEDVLTVCPTTEGTGKHWGTTVHERLSKFRPDVYGDWTRDQLTAALRRHGVTTKQVWATDANGRGANRKGYDMADVEAVLLARTGR